MTWRSTQLDGKLCDQDRIILNLFGHDSVKYVGNDYEFASLLNISNESKQLILIVNHPVWASELYNALSSHLCHPIDKFYVGINRYCVLGNDTNVSAGTLLELVEKFVNILNYRVTQSGKFDNDQGQYFNFVQPLTWIYGSNASDQNN